jgi:hypothetical protein
MSTTSQQPDYSITSDSFRTLKTIDIASLTSASLGSITISGSGGGGSGTSYAYTGSGGTSTTTYTWNGPGGGSGSAGYAIPNISALTTADIVTLTNNYIWKTPEEFVDCWPEYTRMKKMCETYPGLKIAYDKLVTTYRLVKDDYDNPKDKK